MSICPLCKGEGEYINAFGKLGKCWYCSGRGEVNLQPQTNEEWFCELPTEEKANWMSQHFHYCDICDRHVCQGGEECKWYDRNMSESDIFKEWLKAVHKE